MYNRYVPQPDGSYRRSRMEEQKQTQSQRRPDMPPRRETGSQPPPSANCEPTHKEMARHQNQNVTGFLKQLLPKDFDTGDLIIVLLLLLLAGDCEEDRANAMLTLVLYLFM